MIVKNSCSFVQKFFLCFFFQILFLQTKHKKLYIIRWTTTSKYSLLLHYSFFFIFLKSRHFIICYNQLLTPWNTKTSRNIVYVKVSFQTGTVSAPLPFRFFFSAIFIQPGGVSCPSTLRHVSVLPSLDRFNLRSGGYPHRRGVPCQGGTLPGGVLPCWGGGGYPAQEGVPS